MAIVGLADKSVAESKEWVRAALCSLGLALSSMRVAINLSPADVLREGAHFDLPIAVALLVAMGVLPEDSVAARHCHQHPQESRARLEHGHTVLLNGDSKAVRWRYS